MRPRMRVGSRATAARWRDKKREVNSSLTMRSKLRVESAKVVESLSGIAARKLNKIRS